jgi:hypothetical protein
MMGSSLLLRIPVLALLALLAACTTTNHHDAQLIAARAVMIKAEPTGNYFIGRRFVFGPRKFWGYVRPPRQEWARAQLVIMSERITQVPDRLPESPPSGALAHAYDDNFEYRIWGAFSGRRLYDPNSDLVLPEFVPERFELISKSPGWLFQPNEVRDGRRFLRFEAAESQKRHW